MLEIRYLFIFKQTYIWLNKLKESWKKIEAYDPIVFTNLRTLLFLFVKKIGFIKFVQKSINETCWTTEHIYIICVCINVNDFYSY
jgi:hypothetical protein